MAQLKLYSRNEMTKVMHRDRDDYENQKAGELMNNIEFQAKTLARKGYQTGIISRILGISINTVNRLLIR